MSKLEEMKAKADAMNLFIGMLAEHTGDKKLVLLQKQNAIINKTQDILEKAPKMKKKKIDEAISIFEQFEMIIDDFIKTL